MRFLRRLVVRAAQELAANPEARAKASQVLEEDIKPRARKAWQQAQEDIKPRAKKAWQQAQPEIENAKQGFKSYAKKLRDEYRKGRG
ncbi:MAG: hypothetical protein OXH92_17815 [Bryobacterales bacterium]|nr:hypothetical protein [Bryobacterales bacterium]